MAISTEEIWGTFSARLKQFIMRRVNKEYDAENVLQDVFSKIHNNIDKLKDETRLQAWIYQITRNAIIDYYRNRKVTLTLSQIPQEIADEPVTDMDATKEITSYLKPMIDYLPEKYRQAITLSELEGLTHKEMTEILGISLPGVKSRVQRARKMLKEMILECCHIEFDRLGNILDCQPKKSCASCFAIDPNKGMILHPFD